MQVLGHTGCRGTTSAGSLSLSSIVLHNYLRTITFLSPGQRTLLSASHTKEDLHPGVTFLDQEIPFFMAPKEAHGVLLTQSGHTTSYTSPSRNVSSPQGCLALPHRPLTGAECQHQSDSNVKDPP